MIAFLLAAALTLPDPRLTPGAVRRLSPHTVCTTRWSLDVRHVTAKMKRDVFARYGIAEADRGQYLIDHWEPRELAGADVLANLWPQPRAEAKLKDREENRLHRAVCRGAITLQAAQDVMRHWGQP